jgi:hypothetical protein
MKAITSASVASEDNNPPLLAIVAGFVTFQLAVKSKVIVNSSVNVPGLTTLSAATSLSNDYFGY